MCVRVRVCVCVKESDGNEGGEGKKKGKRTAVGLSHWIENENNSQDE